MLVWVTGIEAPAQKKCKMCIQGSVEPDRNDNYKMMISCPNTATDYIPVRAWETNPPVISLLLIKPSFFLNNWILTTSPVTWLPRWPKRGFFLTWLCVLWRHPVESWARAPSARSTLAGFGRLATSQLVYSHWPIRSHRAERAGQSRRRIWAPI